jgi:H+/Cl- antiporter ClcA
LIHRWLLEFTSGASFAAESGRPLDLLRQEISNVWPCFSTASTTKNYVHTNATIFTANESSWHAATLNFIAIVGRSVGIVSRDYFRLARVERAVKGLDLGGPKLEIACRVRLVAAEGDLGRAIR